MLWEDFINSASLAFRINNTEATALILALLATGGILLTIALATRNSNYSGVVTGLSGFVVLSFFTAVGWIAPFFMILGVLLVAGIYAYLAGGILDRN